MRTFAWVSMSLILSNAIMNGWWRWLENQKHPVRYRNSQMTVKVVFVLYAFEDSAFPVIDTHLCVSPWPQPDIHKHVCINNSKFEHQHSQFSCLFYTSYTWTHTHILQIGRSADFLGGPEPWFGFWPQHHSAQHLESIKSWVCLMCKLCAIGYEGKASAPLFLLWICGCFWNTRLCTDEAHFLTRV